MLGLTDRELATAILTFLFVATFVVVPSLRGSVGPAMIGVLKAFLAWQIQVALWLYAGYFVGLIYLASRVGLWDRGILKDTIIIGVFVGLPLFMSANEVKDGGKLIRRVAVEAVGVAALIAFYVNLGSLPLWAELFLQPIVIAGALTAVAIQDKPGHHQAAKLLDTALVVVGLGLLAYTTHLAVTEWNGNTISDAAASLLLAIWLPLALIPFTYFFGFVMHCGVILAMLPFYNDHRKPPLRVRLALIWGLHLSTGLASSFIGEWRHELARAPGWSEAVVAMREFRAASRA